MSDVVDFRGGDFRGPVIGKAEYRQQAPAPTALDALPPRAAGFTGRDEELDRLRVALDPSDPGGGQAVLVTAVSGLGGIGKTALAVQAAYAAREAGWFPGGVLFVDLHGYDDAPVTADQALQSLLRALGVEPEHIPATADERGALYRSVLAEREAVLVLADNASSPEQVRPLLPGGSRHRVLVTSRDRLAQLGARLVPLDQLTPEAAYELLDRALRIADPEDDRVVEEPEAAARLAELCGYLPLALQIAAALLVEDAEQPVAELVAGLTGARDRLTALDDGERSARAAFDLSYRRLPAGPARLLRLLALAPGTEVGEEVVAALAGAEEAPLRDLRTLARAHLVERGSGRGRWRLHDLVRVFGASLAAGDAALREEGEAARERVLACYIWWTAAAGTWLQWSPGPDDGRGFRGRAEALAWLDEERAGLVAAALWAREDRYAGPAMRLALALADYLSLRRQFHDKIAVAQAAQDAARRAGDRHREAIAWNSAGLALREVGRAEEAIHAHARARDLCRGLGNRAHEAVAWNNLGLALRAAGRAEEAIDAHGRARDLYRELGERHGEVKAWGNLAIALVQLDRVEEAIEVHERVRVLFHSLGDRHGEGMAWHNLGLTLWKAGRPEEAIAAYGRARDTHEGLEDWHSMGVILIGLAAAHRDAHHPAEARAHYLQAADAFTRANAPGEAAEARAAAAALTAPGKPTGTPAPAAPPARTRGSGRLFPRPPGAPGTVAR
ncbi:tetratricopeptide repeat protein [Streptomyces sp. NPDC047841]|uniref:tetratricopeptide repeat protein n=1 Tax=Streptomyces sp. NPDC047841 TaxID=3154708 RepID=UPI003453A8B4